MVRDALALLALLSLALTVWRWAASARFPLHRAAAIPASLPGVTLLKPLKGCDAETRRCLRSWLAQEYPGPAQILFGAASAEDPVCALVKELLTEFPKADAALVICPEALGENRKISTLRQLEPRIKHPILIVSDADVWAPPGFAAGAAAMLNDPAVGLAFCFYMMANPTTAAMRWEAVAMNADFWTYVLQSRALGPMNFALGAAMTLPAAELKAIGGFAALADCLADDYQLGRRIAARGKRIEVTTAAVECWEPAADWGHVWRHQSRWATTLRVCEPGRYFASIVNNSTLWPALWMGASLWAGDVKAVAAGAGCVLLRIVTAQAQQARMTRSRAHAAWWWMVPVKDILDCLVWANAYRSGRIVWRGERYRVLPDGRLVSS